MTTPSTPMVNAGILYVNNLAMAWVSNTTFTIGAGQCRDSTDRMDISLAASVTVNAAINGVNGLDTGSLATSTMYAVYAIADSYGNHASGAILSANLAGAINFPTGYDSVRRIGYVVTDGSSHILAFQQDGSGSLRTMWYDAQQSVLSAGTSSSYAAVALNPWVPAGATNVIFNVSVTPTAAGNSVQLRPTGSSVTVGYLAISGDVAAVAHLDNGVCPCLVSASNASVDYKVTGTASLWVRGYEDYL